MNKFVLLFLFFLSIFSCKKTDDNIEVCKALFDNVQGKSFDKSKFFSVSYISNGCEQINNDVPGTRSTVYVMSEGSICTGTIVAENFVLTAAHCLYNQANRAQRMVLNTKIALDDNMNNRVLADVNFIIINPIYKESDLYLSSLGDLAIMQTVQNLTTLGGEIARVTTKVYPNEDVWSVGFGLTGRFHDLTTGGKKRWTMSQVVKNLPDLSPGYEVKFKKSYRQFRDEVDTRFAKNPQDTFMLNKRLKAFQGQTCNGDSGGPQFVRRNGQIALVAATQGINPLIQGKESANVLRRDGDYCHDLATSINTLIAPYIPWINRFLIHSGQSLKVID